MTTLFLKEPFAAAFGKKNNKHNQTNNTNTKQKKHHMLAPIDWIESNKTNMLKNQLASNALVGWEAC